jgi:hypothetical protein
MQPDSKAVSRVCPAAEIKSANHLCRSEIATFRALASKSGSLTVACTQEADLFREVAADEALPASLSFVNIRETAGWSNEGGKAGPKMAALVAASRIVMPPIVPVSMNSHGVALILGRDQAAFDVARQLSDKLDVTLILAEFSEVLPSNRSAFPVRAGRARNAQGWLGNFEVTIDGFAEPAVSSRRPHIVI